MQPTVLERYLTFQASCISSLWGGGGGGENIRDNTYSGHPSPVEEVNNVTNASPT